MAAGAQPPGGTDAAAALNPEPTLDRTMPDSDRVLQYRRTEEKPDATRGTPAMPVTEADRRTLADFRDWIEAAMHSEPGFDAPSRHDREDGSTLATRWAAGSHLWLELAIRPLLPQVRVGVLTDDRWKSEELEQMIEDSGDSMNEFVEQGFSDCGLDWTEPPVEHYRDQGRYFYFATPLDLGSLEELNTDAVRQKARRMLLGYASAFTPSSR